MRWIRLAPLEFAEEDGGAGGVDDFGTAFAQERVAVGCDEGVEGDVVERAMGDDVDAAFVL